jgi:trimethylamine--corrinoid protein Co-methyltransferase
LEDDFLAVDHTHEHFREDWYPDLFDRRNFENWSAGGAMTLRMRAMEMVKELVERHQPEPLEAGTHAELTKIVERAVSGP